MILTVCYCLNPSKFPLEKVMIPAAGMPRRNTATDHANSYLCLFLRNQAADAGPTKCVQEQPCTL